MKTHPVRDLLAELVNLIGLVRNTQLRIRALQTEIGRQFERIETYRFVWGDHLVDIRFEQSAWHVGLTPIATLDCLLDQLTEVERVRIADLEDTADWRDDDDLPL